MTTRKDRQDAAELTRCVLDAVERGELEADSPAARRLLRRLEGAEAAWESERAGAVVAGRRAVRD